MINKTLLPLALTYLNRGWSVVPVGPSKIPLIPWKEYQKKRPTPQELVEWFTKYPDAQVGIVTGAISDLTVIDIEVEGDPNLIKDQTYSVKTGGGGIHRYLKFEPDFKNAVRVFPNCDVRSEGGYVVAAGSTTSKGHYEVLNDIDVAVMSPETKKMFQDASKKHLAPSVTSISAFPSTQIHEPLEYAGYGMGNRNDMMTKFAGAIMAKLHPSLWASVGWQMFEEGNRKNSPPLGLHELKATWESIGSREMKQNPGGRTYTPRREKTWGPADETTESSGESRLQDMQQAEVAEVAEDVTRDSTETLHVAEVAELQTIDTDHTYPLDMPPIDGALLGGFSAGEVIVVAGQSGSGKTTIIQDWTVTLAGGGVGAAREKLPTLWFSYEVLAKPLWEKFQNMGASVDTPIYMPKYNDTGETKWVVDVIEKAIVKWKIRVVAIDHLGFLRPPKGNYANAADAVTHTVRALKKLAVKHGLIILMPVHVRKTISKVPDLNDIRDSLGIAQEADTVFFIGREKDDNGLPTKQAKLWLVKNRKSGISVNATFDFSFGRYYYNANASEGHAKYDGDDMEDDTATARVVAAAAKSSSMSLKDQVDADLKLFGWGDKEEN